VPLYARANHRNLLCHRADRSHVRHGRRKAGSPEEDAHAAEDGHAASVVDPTNRAQQQVATTVERPISRLDLL
jgi:poly(3-hydroxyalkanoate) synthetase